jgi:hypothetical protein
MLNKIFKELYENLKVCFINGEISIDSLVIINDFWEKNVDIIAKIYTTLYWNSPTFKDVEAPTIEQLTYFTLMESTQLIVKEAMKSKEDFKGKKERLEAMNQARIRTQILFLSLNREISKNANNFVLQKKILF